MANPIAPLLDRLPVLPSQGPTPSAPSVTGSASPAQSPARTEFAERLEELVREVDGQQKVAETVARDFASGAHNDLHGTMITTAQAEISLRFVANVRNRLIEAYREVMRMGA